MNLRKSPHDGDGDGFYSPAPGMPDRTPLPRASSLDNRIKALDVRGSALREKKKYKGLTPDEETELDRVNEQYARMVAVRVKSSMAVEKPGKKKGLVPKKVRAGKPRSEGTATRPAVGGIGQVRARVRPNELLAISGARALMRMTAAERAELRESIDNVDEPDRLRVDRPSDRETRPLTQRGRLDSLFMYQWYKDEAEQRRQEALDQARAIQGGGDKGGPIVRDVIRDRSKSVVINRRQLTPEELATLQAAVAAAKKNVKKRRGSRGWARFQPGKNDPARYKKPNPKSTPKEIVGHHGHRPHGKSIYWPALYEHLRAKGMSKAKAAAISNAAWKKKRMGIATNTPTSVRGVVKCEEPTSPWDIVLTREAQRQS